MSIQVLEIHDLFDQFSKRVDGKVEQNNWEQRLTIPEHVGRGTVTRTRIRPGMELLYTDVTYAEDMKLQIQEDCSLFELSYSLSGDIYCEWNGKHSYTKQQTGNILFLEDVRVYEEKRAGIRNQLLELRLTPNELLFYAGDLTERSKMESWLKRHKDRIDEYPVTIAMQQCVREMVECSIQGSMKRLYLESKALEWLALFGESDGYGALEGASKLRLSRDDIQKLEQVRELVCEYFEQPLSIREIAKRVGINEFNMKKGFREWSVITIFELVRQKRMEKALWYIEVERLNVGETAASVGYSNASNFTAVFRKHYGCNPSEYVRSVDRQLP